MVRDLFALTKPRVTWLVVATAAAGCWMAWRAGAGAPPAATGWLLLHVVLGTAMVAGGTNALNQWWERDTDALMRRTSRRPLPAGRLAARTAFLFAWALGLIGIGYLAASTTLLAAALAAATLVSYVFAYTPLKRLSATALLVGAVPGALPVLGGWAAAGIAVDVRAWSLFLLLLAWQLPHFLALNWMYRRDYAAAGLVTVAARDPDGRHTARLTCAASAALLIAGIGPVVTGLGGPVSGLAAITLGGWQLAVGVKFLRCPNERHARTVFLSSLAYLPVILTLLVIGA